VQGVEPRIWLGLSLAFLFASVVPYWYWIGDMGILLCAVLALTAAAFLWANFRGERRLMLERDELQRRTDEGAPSATNGSGTSAEPSSRW
jgi:hypothetical protein